MKKTVKDENGFTLVELIVVMSTLLVLAVIGITRFAGLTDDAKLQADQSLASSIAVAAQAWIAEGDHTYSKNTISIQS